MMGGFGGNPIGGMMGGNGTQGFYNGAMGLAGGQWNSPLGILFIILAVVAFIFWLVMLIDLVKRPVKDKTMWVLLFIFVHIIGAIVYYFTGRKSAEMVGEPKHHDAPKPPAPPKPHHQES